MTQQDKDLLLRDLCARLPYGVICRKEYNNIKPMGAPSMEICSLTFLDYNNLNHNGFKSFKPYLRPISSMTHSEYDEYLRIKTHGKPFEVIDWLNARHIDYRKLIDKGLAIAVTDENNPYKI